MLKSGCGLLRLAARAIWFAVELLLFFSAYIGLLLRRAGRLTQLDRSHWLQWCARRTLRIFSVRVRFVGAPPRAGLLVSNHLSYLDILVLVSLTPAVFVSKSEVKNWPVFGWFARLAGTLFVDRARRGDVTRMNSEIALALANGNVVVVFPEGTSWNGAVVLPFKSSLLEPMVGAKYPLGAAGLRYTISGGVVAEDVCYWGEMTFFPHLLKLMTKHQVQAWVAFAAVSEPAPDRKALALQLQAEVTRLVSAAG